MEEILTRVWEDLVGRLHGPLTLRLLLQPTVAVILAIRAGLKDARAGRPPYFWTILTDPAQRRELVQQGWKDVGKVFIFAVVLDVIYQFIVVRWLYPGETLIVAIILAVLPYLLIRGLVTRLARSRTSGLERS